MTADLRKCCSEGDLTIGCVIPNNPLKTAKAIYRAIDVALPCKRVVNKHL